uniref:Kunitz/Bovine pancreatic trypsin inhibitor domain protein n=1 Tax=Panagrolaimus davidi TaxID=227884 RepID=A0A914QUA2_9BILA
MRSQFVLRYYLRGGECVSYPYGHCANDDNEPKLFRYKEECEDTCVKAVTADSPTTVKPKESDSLVVDSKEVVETDTQVPQSSGEITYATGGIDSTTGSSYQSPKTECQRQRDSRGQGLIKGGFIPECSANGEFKQLQCEQDKSEYFCVNVEGIEIDNSRTKSGQEKPDCEKIISASGQRTNECVGGADVGPCRSAIPRFFYDESTQSCQPFSYSGCGGNGNNYANQAACERRCVPTKEAGKCHKGKDPLRTSQGQLVNCAKTECPAGYKCNVIQHSSVCCPDDEKSVVGVLHSGIGAAAYFILIKN